MSRKDYISDNLVDIRDRFKQNYATVAASRSGGEEAAEPSSAVDTPPVPTPVAPPVAPPVSVSGGGETAERLRRELAVKIGRDLAATAAELELIELRRGELRRFHSELKDMESELASAVTGGGLEALRYRYSRAAGRGGVFSDGERRPVEAAGGGGSRWLEALPLISGMLLAAALIALALVFVFL